MSDIIPDGDPSGVTAKRRTSIAVIAIVALVAGSAFIGYLAGQGGDDGDPAAPDTIASESPTTPDGAASTDPSASQDSDGADAPLPSSSETAPGDDDDDAIGTPPGDGDTPAPDGPVLPAQPAPPAPVQPAVDQGTFDPTAVYAAGDTVTYGGETFTALQQTVGWTPTADGHPTGVTGYGAETTGGAGGREVMVTSLADSGPGSLREAAASTEPTWVRFAVNGTIEVGKHITVGSNTTIDGRGADITLTGNGLDIRETENVIITNLTFESLTPTRQEVDGIRVTNNSRNVWIDHVTISQVNDEAINIGEFSTNVTVSWTHIFDTDKGILVGNHQSHDVSDDPSFATVHHTWFENLNQRAPRAVRWAHLNLVNSLVDGWVSTGASAAQNAQLVSQGNIFLVPQGGGDVVITRGGQGRKNPQPGFASSTNDRVEGPANAFAATDAAQLFAPPYSLPIADPDADLEQTLRTFTGAQDVPSGGPWALDG